MLQIFYRWIKKKAFGGVGDEEVESEYIFNVGEMVIKAILFLLLLFRKLNKFSLSLPVSFLQQFISPLFHIKSKTTKTYKKLNFSLEAITQKEESERVDVEYEWEFWNDAILIVAK